MCGEEAHMSYSRLVDVLQNCTVRVIRESGSGYGTGFFVAPGKILTCAHVIGDEQSTKVNISWKSYNVPAKVQRYITQTALNQEQLKWPDLAMLTVELEEHPCVLFLPEYDIGDELYTFGYTDEYPNGDSTTAQIEGVSNSPEMIKFKLGQVRPGMSGSPLLNLRTGGVCGVVKISRDKAFDLGGRAITTLTVIENFPELVMLQTRFHQLNGVWIQEMNAEQQFVLEQIPHRARNSLAQIGATGPEQLDTVLGLYWKLHELTTDISPYGTWELASPIGAYVSTIVSDPNDEKTLYVGMNNNQGIFKSVDGGLSWTSINIGLGCKDINSIKISPYNRIIYATTDRGVWMSENQGSSWKWYSDEWEGKDVLCMLFSLQDPNFIAFGTRAQGQGGSSMFSATVVGASTSTNEPLKPRKGLGGGYLHISRKTRKDWVTFPVKTINDFMFSPHDARVAYIASADDGLYVTRDEFESLEKVESMAKNRPVKIAIPLDNESVIAIGSLQGLYLSDDGGNSWRQCEEVGYNQVPDIAFVNGSAHHILAASTNGVFESLNGGESWQEANDGLTYLWSMAITQSGDRRIFVGTSGGGVYRRDPKRQNWVATNIGFPTTSALSMATSQGYLFAGGNGIYRSTDSGNSWKFIGLNNQPVWSIASTTSEPISKEHIVISGMRLSRDGGGSWNTVDTAKNNVVYAGTSNKIYVSEDNGNTWRLLITFETEAWKNAPVRDLVLSSSVPGLMYACVDYKGLLRSTDLGQTWEQFGTTVFAGDSISSLKLLYLPDEILFACGMNGSIYWSIDEGESWKSSEMKFEHPITDIIQSNDGHRVYVTSILGEIFESTDKGSSFTQLRHVENTQKQGDWATLFVHPTDGNIFLGTDTGAFSSSDGGRTWQPIWAGILGTSYYVNRFLFANSIVFAAMKEGVFRLTKST
jgi:photosystem II stability/assembly factor-like uncharacterized protein